MKLDRPIIKGFCKNDNRCRFLHDLNEDKLDAAMASPQPSPLDFRTPLGSLLMSPLSPMNQRAAATTELMLAGDESRFMGQSRIDQSEFDVVCCHVSFS
ncbi:uncharacterized protein A4U43_C02F2980 [Asparagus officinalis]|uniref:C3H1-type domain-containing protein n=1 Tax=Asparagus officinalis TaxID=4686 RepID=A0A5P1FFE9_ASPOF|nr:uncharacterized protein A4U43_C02F2980 [Asparagus officinalis]